MGVRKKSVRKSRRGASGHTVEIANHQRRRVPRKAIENAVERVLEMGDWKTAEISIGVVDGPTMRRLNRDYLDHDYVTDVLSFQFVRQTRQKYLAGEIVVCADLAAKIAAANRWKWQDELVLYVIHGALHLIGYNDQTTSQRRRMRSVERKILRELSIPIFPGELITQPKDPA